MELNNVELLLEKYFNAETSISEENELRKYFASSEVKPNLKQYQSMFGYYAVSVEQKSAKIEHVKAKTVKLPWLSIAASVAVLVGVVSYVDNRSQVENRDLGTYDSPEAALIETQRALAMLSGHVNTGIKSVTYIKEYKKSKNLIFKQ